MFIYIGFVSLYGWLVRFYESKREALIFTTLVWSALIVASTELMSVFGLITTLGLYTFWLFVVAASCVLAWKQRASWKKLSPSIPIEFGWWEKGMILFIVILTLLLLHQGLHYAPNNYDSMTYRLSRVMRWSFQQSVAHYATHIPRQLFMPPFAEFVALHSFLLQKSDIFLNSIQLFYLLVVCSGVSLIVKELGGNSRVQLYSAFIALTFPMAVLQASSTQNDIVTGCFLVIIYWFLIRIHRKKLTYDFGIGLGVATSLLILTKGASFIWLMFPTLVAGSILLHHLIKKIVSIGQLVSFMVVAITPIVLVIPHFYRNWQVFGNLLGTTADEQKLYSCEEYSLIAIGSNLIRNIALHFKEVPINNLVEYLVKQYLPQNYLNNPVNTFPTTTFDLQVTVISEDYLGSYLATLLVLVGLCFVPFFAIKLRKDKVLLFYILSLLVSGVLFCVMIKWNPWATRLHLSLFLLSAPLLAFLIEKTKNLVNYLAYAAIVFIGVYAIIFAIFNINRPLIEIKYVTNTIYDSPRFERQFPGSTPERISSYKKISSFLADKDSIGIMLGLDSWEYPLYTADFEHLRIPKTVRHIYVTNNPSKVLEKPIMLNYIVTEGTRGDSILYGNHTYYLVKDSSLQTILLYEKDTNNHVYNAWAEENQKRETVPLLILYMKYDAGVLSYYKEHQNEIGLAFDDWLPSSALWHYQNRHQSPYFNKGQLQDFVVSFKEPDNDKIRKQLFTIMQQDEGVKQYYEKHKTEIGKSFTDWLPDAMNWHIENKDQSSYFVNGELSVDEKTTIPDFVNPIRQQLAVFSFLLAALILLALLHNFSQTLLYSIKRDENH